MPDWRAEISRRLPSSEMDPASESDLVQELAQHLEDRYAELLAGGEEEPAARNMVLQELDNLKKLPVSLPPSKREHRPAPLLSGPVTSGNFLVDLVRDLRYGSRVIRKTPLFTLFAVLSLGLGIGANTTVFTIINSLVLNPLPVSDPSRLVAIYDTSSKSSGQSGNSSNQAGGRLPLSYANFEDYAAGQHSFRNIAAFTPPMVMTLRGNAGPERMFGEFVTRQYFDALGLRPVIGRFFLVEEDSKLGNTPVAVLSYNAWKGRFGGSSDVLGRTLELNNIAFTIVGVAPQGFLGLSAVFGPDAWLPATMSERAFPTEFSQALSDRAKPLFHGMARLNSGLTLKGAQANLEAVSTALRTEYPDANEGHGILVRPITDELFSASGSAGGLYLGSAILLAIVGLVLAIACSNVANLLLARAAQRSQELAVRMAIGAGRGRLVRQMLAESLLLSLMSCLAGIAIGYFGCRFIWSFVPAEVTQNMVAPKLDTGVLAFALLVSLATAFLFGLMPALRASRTDVVSALKEETRASTRGRQRVTLGNLLLIGQVAFSLVCLITAALFSRGIQHAYTISPGFQTDHLAILMMNAGQAGYGETRVKELYQSVRDRISSQPGVASVSWASGLPFWKSPSRTIVIAGQDQRRTSGMIATVAITVDTGYFPVMGIPLMKGRLFSDTDRDGSPPVALINEALAQEHWPNGDALGARVQFPGDKAWRQIVGIVKTANYTTLGEAPQPCVYIPLRQNYSDGMTLYVRSREDPGLLLTSVQREIRSLDPNIQISDVRTGGKLIEQVLWSARVGVTLLGVFGTLALALASVGLYGIMAYSVTQRTKEIGVRMALGGSPSNVLRMIIRDGMVLVCWGVGIGLGICLLMGRLLSRMLFGINSADPLSLAGASLVLMLVALVACYLPARSATRIDPMVALHET